MLLEAAPAAAAVCPDGKQDGQILSARPLDLKLHQELASLQLGSHRSTHQVEPPGLYEIACAVAAGRRSRGQQQHTPVTGRQLLRHLNIRQNIHILAIPVSPDLFTVLNNKEINKFSTLNRSDFPGVVSRDRDSAPSWLNLLKDVPVQSEGTGTRYGRLCW